MTRRGSPLHWAYALVRNLFRGSARDAELRADIDAYVDLLTDEKIAAGLPPAAARRAARLECGSIDAVKDDTRRARAGAWLIELGQDGRHAARMMRRDLSFTAIAIVTLALGIGANTAIFSVVNAVLLEPLSYPGADRIVVVWERNPAIDKERDPVAPANFEDWRRENESFEDLGAYRFRGFALDDATAPEQLLGLSVSSSLFRVLGTAPLLGRVFTEDEQRRRDPVVVLAHDVWQRRFGGRESVIGSPVSLNGASFTIVGVMPAGFAFPDGDPVDLYAPLVYNPDESTRRTAHVLSVVARLKDDVTIERATADLQRIAQQIAAADSNSNPDVTVAGAHDVLVEDVRLGLVVLFGTVGFVLLIACANVANLLMVRATSRRREIVVRAALGANRGRLFRQLLTESVLLAGVGAAAGVLLARGLLAAFRGFHPPDLPRADQVAIDTTVLLFVTVAALITGMIFGIVPALQSASPSLSDATKAIGRTVTARTRGRSALLVSEIALSLMLLAGAGLMIRSLLELHRLDLGFSPRGVFTAQLTLPAARYPVPPFGPPLALGQSRSSDSPATPQDAKPYLFFHELEQRLRSAPGIEEVGAVSALPLNPVGTDYDLPVIVEGQPRARAGEETQADFRVVTEGYFRAMRIPLLAGREFTEFDGPASTPVVIINQITARELFGGVSPIGQRLVLYGRPREIVGVVGSLRHHGFARDPRAEMILPYRQFQFSSMTLVVRSAIAQASVAGTIRTAVRSLDAQLPVYRLRAMDDFLADSIAQPRFVTVVLGAFAVLALVLALVGVYGVMSYVVGQRQREIAVRMAVGAGRLQVITMIAGQSFSYAAVGVVVGLAAAAAGTRLMSGLLFGVTSTDAATFASATAAVIIAALAATAIPAWRAARSTPVNALRVE
jgi:putative ABC transport system permease protein